LSKNKINYVAMISDIGDGTFSTGIYHMETWVIANQKGGVGKTTTTLTLGALLASRGKRILMVDLDPHASLTAYLKFDPDTAEGSVYEVLLSGQSINQNIKKTEIDNLYLLPASPALATLDRRLGTQQGAGTALKKALSQLVMEVDYVLVDCPPTMGILMVNALAAANFLIIPVQTEFLALKGLERMKNTLAMITRARKISIPTLIVPSLYDRRTRAGRDTLEMLRDIYTDDLWDLVIPIDTQFRDASKKGVPLTALNSHARGVIAFEALLDTILEMRGEEGVQRKAEIKEVQTL
jgi:chromosome partitioning protein